MCGRGVVSFLVALLLLTYDVVHRRDAEADLPCRAPAHCDELESASENESRGCASELVCSGGRDKANSVVLEGCVRKLLDIKKT